MPNRNHSNHSNGDARGLAFAALIKAFKARIGKLPDHDVEIRISLVSRSLVASPDSRLLTVRQALHYAAMSRSKLYELIEAGTVQRRKDGRKSLIVRSSLDRYQSAVLRNR